MVSKTKCCENAYGFFFIYFFFLHAYELTVAVVNEMVEVFCPQKEGDGGYDGIIDDAGEEEHNAGHILYIFCHLSRVFMQVRIK